jgi:hypothetical protein
MFDATLGRFLQRDPAGPQAAGGSLDLYEYAGDNPADWMDPSGLIVIYSRSGINDNPSTTSVRRDVEEYVKNRQPAPFGVVEEGNVTYGGHVGSNITTTDLTGLGPNDAAARLNREAEALANQCQVGEYCIAGRKTKIGVVMVAPKTQIASLLLKSSCCEVTFLTFYSSQDTVPNQRPGTKEDWGALGPAHDIVLGSLQHGWDPEEGRANGSPFSPANRSRFGNRLRAVERLKEGERPTFRLDPRTDFTDEINRTLSADKDYGFVCHSQGCNITMYELLRKCNRNGKAPIP